MSAIILCSSHLFCLYGEPGDLPVHVLPEPALLPQHQLQLGQLPLLLFELGPETLQHGGTARAEPGRVVEGRCGGGQSCTVEHLE